MKPKILEIYADGAARHRPARVPRARAILCAALMVGLVCVLPERASAQTFGDVPSGHWAFAYIEALANSGITSGCGGGNYCPDEIVTRSQMAIFLERGLRGGDYTPPPATGTVFFDVAANSFGAAFIEQFVADGITSGCGGGNYCPTQAVSRAQMAVFLLRAEHGAAYTPPPAVGLFSDVGPGAFAASFIEQLAAEGITSGCGGGNFCPNASVTRAQMAVFLSRLFRLPGSPGGLLTWNQSNWDESIWQ